LAAFQQQLQFHNTAEKKSTQYNKKLLN